MKPGAGITRLAMLPLEFHRTLSCSGLHCVDCSGGGGGGEEVEVEVEVELWGEVLFG